MVAGKSCDRDENVRISQKQNDIDEADTRTPTIANGSGVRKCSRFLEQLSFVCWNKLQKSSKDVKAFFSAEM